MAKQRHVYVNFVGEPAPLPLDSTGVALATGNNTTTSIFETLRGHYFEVNYKDATNNAAPSFVPAATGWTIPIEAEDNTGIEITHGITAATTTNLIAGTAGTDSMFVRASFSIADVDQYDVFTVGLRRAAGYAAIGNIDTPAEIITAYNDVACLSANHTLADPGAIYTCTRLAAGVGTATDTTDTWADTEVHTLEVRMTAAGVCTFLIDNAAPTVNTNTVTLTATQVIIPYICIVRGAAGASAVVWRTYEAGVNVSPT